MRQNLRIGVLHLEFRQTLRTEQLVDDARPLPHDQIFSLGLLAHVASQVAIRREDDRAIAQVLHHLDGI